MTPEWLCCRRRGVERGGGLLWGPLLLEAAQPGARDVRGFSPGRRHVESGEAAERGEQETRPRALGRPGAARRTTPSPVPCDPPGDSSRPRRVSDPPRNHLPTGAAHPPGSAGHGAHLGGGPEAPNGHPKSHGHRTAQTWGERPRRLLSAPCSVAGRTRVSERPPGFL